MKPNGHAFRDSLLMLLLPATLFAGGFDVTGQVIGVNRGEWGWILLADDVVPNNFNVNGRDVADCRSGDIVRALGYARPGDSGQTDFVATNVIRQGQAPLPATVEISGSQVNDAALFHRCVRIRGVISSVRQDDTNREWIQLGLRTPSGKICAVIQESDCPIDTLRPLVDAEVTLSGYITRFGAFHRFLGNELMLFGTNGIDIVSRPTADPFAVAPLDDDIALHRRRTDGVVIANDRTRTYLATDTIAFLPVILSADAPRPPVGSRVSVTGFAENDMRGPQLADAEIRVADGPTLPPGEATDVSVEALFTDSSGNEAIDTLVYGKPIRLQGHVDNTSENIRLYRSLTLSCGRRTITVDLSQLNDDCDTVPLGGCTVSVAGLCIPTFERDAASSWIPRFTGFTLIPRTAADIRIIARPSWWTTAKLLSVIGLLLVLLSVILVWNRMLRVMSEHRGRDLAHALTARVRSDLKIEERTRLAVELHDSLSQMLTGVALQVDGAATANASSNPVVGRHLSLCRQMLASCRKELQGCLWDLRTRTFAEKDVNEAVHRAIEPQLGGSKATIRFNVPRETLSESALHALLRIVRELVSNAVRHGHATRIHIAGEYKNGTVRFSVRDNGVGFDPATAPGPSSGHFGLRGIRERLAEFSGSLDVRSSSGRGSRFIVTLPTDQEQNA